MAKVVIFGTGDAAELAHYYFKKDSPHEVVAFVVDKPYIKSRRYKGLPVIDFSKIHQAYSPTKFKMFIAVGYVKINSVRRKKYMEAKKKKYSLVNYVSSKATVFENMDIGKNCFILENTIIQPFVKIGNNVTIWSGSHVGHHRIRLRVI